MIDRKFKFVALNPCNNKVYTEEDAVVFCAKDAALPAALHAYKTKCEELGCDANHLESIELLQDRVFEYQHLVERRIPDTDTPCEIDRCIGGKA